MVTKKTRSSTRKSKSATAKPKRKVYNLQGKIDRSKRQVINSEVDQKNILPEGRTRRRKDFDYKETLVQSTFSTRSRARPSHNTAEKRSKSEKLYVPKARPTRRNRQKLKEQSEDEAENEHDVDVKESEDEKEETKDSNSGMDEESSATVNSEHNTLSEAVVQQIERLGGKLTPFESARAYRSNPFCIPPPIQQLIDVAWPADLRFNSKKYNITGLQFTEFEVKEWDEIEWLKSHPDALLFGEEEAGMIAALQNDEKQDQCDFNVYILRDLEDTYKVEEPVKLSEFLASLSK